jgi:hypothetical protein
MSATDRLLATELDSKLQEFSSNKRNLPGIRAAANRATLVRQFIDSIHRVKYISVVATRNLSALRADPSSDLFDPIKGAILRFSQEQHDEACWLVFLSVHFGKHRRAGWRLARDVYGRLGHKNPWTWRRVSARPDHFRDWLAENQDTLKNDGILRRFGNHRKYQSLDARSSGGTGAAIESYVKWSKPARNHLEFMMSFVDKAGGDRRKAFHLLYESMEAVAAFGRTARFDYLTMIGKMKLAPIEPGSTYMQGATGPFDGARLLFGKIQTVGVSRTKLDAWLVELGGNLGVGMQEMEDALCNWQKSPARFKHFGG